MKLKLEIEVTTISYKGKVIFKAAEFNNGNETTMNDLKWKTIPFEMEPEDKKIAEEALIVYDDELNAGGYDEFFRFISNVNNFPFFKVEDRTEYIEF